MKRIGREDAGRRRRTIYSLIVKLEREKGYPPTIREIQELTEPKLGLTTIRRHIDSLKREGLLTSEKGKARTTRARTF